MRPGPARVVCCVVLLSACSGRALSSDGGPPTGADAAADGNAKGDVTQGFPAASLSGTRLRARTWVTEDGTRRLDRDEDINGSFGGQLWVDTQLGVPCRFQQQPTGELACEPVATFGDPSAAFAPVLGYADAECTQRIAFGPFPGSGIASQASRDAYCGGKAYAVVMVPLPGPDLPFPVYSTGQPLSLSVWYKRGFGIDECVATATPPGVQVVPMGQQVLPADLVVGHIETVPTGHRLSYQQIVADDGTRERVGWYDTATNVQCTVTPFAMGPVRCVPHADSAFFLGDFGDAACTKPLIYAGGYKTPFVQPVPAEPPLVTAVPLDSYYRVGTTPAAVYEEQNGVCVKTDQDPSTFALAEEFPLAAFDAFADVDLSPAGARLGLAARADAEGATDPVPGTLTDRTSRLPCDLKVTTDGKTRCLPPASQMRYPENTCSAMPFVSIGSPGPAGRLIYDIGWFGEGCSNNATPTCVAPLAPATPPSYASGWSGDFCTGGVTFHEVGAVIPTPAKVYDAESYGCDQNPYASGNSQYTFNAVGAEVPPSSFAEAKLIVE
jgi:hypothetical protein